MPAVAWRDAVAALRAPGRVIEALVLSAASAAVATAQANWPLVVAAAMVAGYLGAARMLWPLRAEFDIPDRVRVLLRPRTGRVLLEHLIVSASRNRGRRRNGNSGGTHRRASGRGSSPSSRSPSPRC